MKIRGRERSQIDRVAPVNSFRLTNSLPQNGANQKPNDPSIVKLLAGPAHIGVVREYSRQPRQEGQGGNRFPVSRCTHSDADWQPRR